MTLTAEPSSTATEDSATEDSATEDSADEVLGPDEPEVGDRHWPSPLAIAACASIGAGAIHASVVGAHGEHRFLATMFVWAAAFQICWGIATLLRTSRTTALVGFIGNFALAMAWMVTRLTGVSWIDGLETAEKIQFADAAAGGLAIVAAGIAFGALLTPGSIEENRLTNLSIPAFLVACLALPAMVTGGTQVNAHSEPTTVTTGHDHASSAGASPATAGQSVPHDHGTATTTPASATNPSADPTPTAPAVAAVVAPTPYDPTKPIDLSGVDGVTPEQQARAENLVAITLARLPKFADPAVATALGWRSIGDALTGYEHFINLDLTKDDQVLNPDLPESLVYRVDGNKRTLVSAMFMLSSDTALDAVPDIGGQLTQWHIHDDLCFTPDPEGPRVAGITGADGACPAPLVTLEPFPMIHVWIVPHPCGPFASLEGLGAGQIAPGDTRWCDHVHGASTTFG